MLEDKARQHDQQVVDKFHDPVAAYTMTTRDYVMRPRANNATHLFVLTLPPVAEAKGRFYSIIARDADAVNTITITDQNDSECWKADIVLNRPCDGVLMYSDGLAWIALPSFWPGVPHTVHPQTTNPATQAPTLVSTSLAPTTTGA